ncbi:YadA-like family protein [Salmonella enterica]|nr:YadA-like family protein [Salmonella enterica]EIK7835628.1 YadA-like family protein [Salmonella enterica]EKA1932618.1 YadA-like family protein [Salmonella enterica]ELI2615344.1 YadA-like family protein [Salmonella enterica]ELI2723535.1 YadA-like family protein [Salmonella enterica]
MKTSTKSIIAVCVFSALFATTVKAAPASYTQSWGDMVESDASSAAISITDLKNNKANQSDLDKTNNTLALTNSHLAIVDSELNGAKNGVIIVNDDLQSAKQALGAGVSTAQATANTALQGTQANAIQIDSLKQQAASGVFNGKDGDKGDKGDTGATGATGAQGVQGVAGVAGSAGANGADGKPGDNGKDGKDGKDGVTTTVNTTTVKHEVDTATQATVASNKQQVAAMQSNQKAQEQRFNSQFKHLSDKVDGNRKAANAGISGALAVAGLPQVQANQKFMFSAGAGTYEGESALAVGASVNITDRTVVKAGFSADTQDNFGASVGIGLGF